MKLVSGEHERYFHLVFVSVLLLLTMPLVQFVTPAIAEMVKGVSGNLELSMTVENTTIVIGEVIDIILTLKNTGNDTMIIGFSDCQIFDVLLLDEYYIPMTRWSYGMFFCQALVDIELEPGETYSQTLQWNLYLYSGGTFIPPQPGNYYLVGECVGVPKFGPPRVTTTALPITLMSDPTNAVAAFSYSPNHSVVNRTTTFNASASVPGWNGTAEMPIVSYAWNFGDGFNTTEADPLAEHVYTEVGDYNVTLTVVDSRGLNDTVSQTITVKTPEHDVAVISVTPECTATYNTWGIAGGSPNLEIEVKVENQGSEAENFNVTVWYINETGPPGLITRGTIASKNVTLAAGANTTLTFNWNVRKYKVDKYTIAANASVVSGETDVADNTKTGPIVTLKYGGDTNGDGFIDGYDVTILSIWWWIILPPWPIPCHPADFNNDLFIGGFDATVVSINWWTHVPKPE